MKKFEYKVKEYFTELGLNNLGDDGWELVSVIYKDDGESECFFKREIEEIINGDDLYEKDSKMTPRYPSKPFKFKKEIE